MGNRAVISFKYKNVPKEFSPSIYLHWNGGRDSIEAFLLAHKMCEHRYGDYGIARLIQLISNYFAGGLSIGVSTYNNLDTDNYDNGVYWICPDTFKIIDREFNRYKEQNSYDVLEMAEDIVSRTKEKNTENA